METYFNVKARNHSRVSKENLTPKPLTEPYVIVSHHTALRSELYRCAHMLMLGTNGKKMASRAVLEGTVLAKTFGNFRQEINQ